MFAIEAIDLSHQFSKGEKVLNNINFAVETGSIYGFLGPNGAGKTTTLRLVLGLLRKQTGEIKVFGKPFDENRTEILRGLGSLIESPSLYGQLTAAENLLPIGVILATSLITQLEFRNNTWKQLHTTPQYLTTIFVAKLAVIVVMMVQFLLLFNVAIYLTGIIPHLILGPTLPQQPFPFYYFLEKTSYFFIDCLPIIALQYLIGLQFKNFLVPLSVGLGLLVASLIATEWTYGYTIPYTYCPLNFMALRKGLAPVFGSINIHLWAFGYFILFTITSYLLYIFQKEKG